MHLFLLLPLKLWSSFLLELFSFLELLVKIRVFFNILGLWKSYRRSLHPQQFNLAALVAQSVIVMGALQWSPLLAIAE
jgi:hypothetical protein